MGVLGLMACGGAGEDGAPGANGADGTSCSVTDNGDGTATIACNDGTEATVSSGATGPRGTDGEDGATGPSGATGATGPAGATGAAGSDAEATRIIESFFCGGTLESFPDLRFSYNAVLMSSGDLFVAGEVYDLFRTSSNVAFYSPSQVGYATASVTITFDFDGSTDGGWWQIYLDRGTLVTVIEYHLTNGGPVAATWTMQPGACVHNFY